MLMKNFVILKSINILLGNGQTGTAQAKKCQNIAKTLILLGMPGIQCHNKDEIDIYSWLSSLSLISEF